MCVANLAGLAGCQAAQPGLDRCSAGGEGGATLSYIIGEGLGFMRALSSLHRRPFLPSGVSSGDLFFFPALFIRVMAGVTHRARGQRIKRECIRILTHDRGRDPPLRRFRTRHVRVFGWAWRGRGLRRSRAGQPIRRADGQWEGRGASASAKRNI